MRSRRNKIPQINSSSSADIAFLLLTFFLVTSSLDTGKGLYRRLAPAISEDAVKKKMDIRERNLLTFSIDENNQVLWKDTLIAIDHIKPLTKEFISNPENKEYLPEKREMDVPFFGSFQATTRHSISLKISRESNFQTYISVQNELTAAYNELRSELAQQRFKIPYDRLSDEQQAAIREIYPQRISETEYRPTGKEANHE